MKCVHAKVVSCNVCIGAAVLCGVVQWCAADLACLTSAFIQAIVGRTSALNSSRPMPWQQVPLVCWTYAVPTSNTLMLRLAQLL